jgi:hypothetical protein
MLFCPGELGASGELELKKGPVCSTCQREIDMFFLMTGLRIDRYVLTYERQEDLRLTDNRYLPATPYCDTVSTVAV